MRETHDSYLDNLVSSLHLVGERPLEIEWIMKDGVWMPEGTTRKNKLCDVICSYYDGSVSCIELKANRNKRPKAIQQCYSGRSFAINVLGAREVCMKVVYYHSGKYDFEVIG